MNSSVSTSAERTYQGTAAAASSSAVSTTIATAALRRGRPWARHAAVDSGISP